MEKSKKRGREECWRAILNAFVEYEGSCDERLRENVAAMTRRISSSASLSEEFLIRFVERKNMSFEEKYHVATAALEAFPGANHLRWCVQILELCTEISRENQRWDGDWIHDPVMNTTIYEPAKAC